jgi:thioesterase domain-containing protein
MARQLAALGQRVPLVVFIDTFHPSATARKLTLDDRLTRLREEGPAYLFTQAKYKFTRHARELSRKARLRYFTGRGLPLPRDLRELTTYNAFEAAAARYQPLAYAGEVLLFRAASIAEVYRHIPPALGWRELIPRLELVEVPGGHESLLSQPNVRILARRLAHELASRESG